MAIPNRDTFSNALIERYLDSAAQTGVACEAASFSIAPMLAAVVVGEMPRSGQEQKNFRAPGGGSGHSHTSRLQLSANPLGGPPMASMTG